MWCMYPNGTYVPPFPIKGKKEKSPKDKTLNDDSQKEITGK
jgi:hypothetical protein